MKVRQKFSSVRRVMIGVIIAIAIAPQAVYAVAPFTFVALPDIQNETQDHPEMLQSQVNWILSNRYTQNIACVSSQGDLVNHATDEQFTTTHNILFQLNNASGLPWGTAKKTNDLGSENIHVLPMTPATFAPSFGPTDRIRNP